MNKLLSYKIHCFFFLVLISVSGYVGAVVTSDSGSSSTSIGSPIDFPVSPPRLIVDKMGSYTGEKITITAFHMQGRQLDIPVDISNWQIIDAAGIVVVNESAAVIFEWTPDTAGNYKVKHTFTSNEIELSVNKDLTILNAVDRTVDLMDRFWMFEEKLLGIWKGEIVSAYGRDIKVNVAFYSDGSYAMSRVSKEIFLPEHSPIFSPPIPGIVPGSPTRSPPTPKPPLSSPISPPNGNLSRPLMLLTNMINFNQEKGNFELLDIWANGEIVGNMQPVNYPTVLTENMQHIRFNDEYNMLFFDLQLDPFFRANTDTFVLSRMSDTANLPTIDIIKDKLIGEWQGSATTFWATPYEVSFVFSDDGSYQAKSVTETMLSDGENLGLVSPLYFGAIDQTADGLQYSIEDFENSTGSGSIDVKLKNGEQVTGTISDLEMSLDYSVLIFTFKHYGKYGPMRYVLERQ